MFSNSNDVAVATPVHTASAYDHSTGTDGKSSYESKKQASSCRDPLFAVLFYANIAVMVGLYAKFGFNPFANLGDDADNNNQNDNEEVDIDTSALVYSALASGGFAALLSFLAFIILLNIPGILIKTALIFNIVASALAAGIALVFGNIVGAIIGLIFFLIMCCYARAVWSRIPFATANLVTACTAIKTNCGVSLFGYIFTILAFAWTLLWSIVVAGVQDELFTCEEVQNADGDMVNQCSNPAYHWLFLLFVSYFFTHQVLQNCVHVTVVGVVGTWWFVPEEAASCCSSSIFKSLTRTLTSSFGSICFGSLLVAIVQAIRQIVETARQNDDLGPFLACCIDCILGCIESLLEYFNKWAFVYVGLYGYGYCEAGKNVMNLFRERGWDAIIADDLVGMALGLLSLVVGLLTGACAVALEQGLDWFGEDWEYGNGDIWAFVIGLIVGLVICSILLVGTIASAVNAVIVLFAEGPAEFEKNYPELSSQMREAYLVAYPGCL